MMDTSDKIFDEIVTQLGQIQSATEQLREAKTRTAEVVNNSIQIARAAESATKAAEQIVGHVTQQFDNLKHELGKLEHDFRSAIEQHQSKILDDYTERIGQLRAEYERIIEEFRSSDFTSLVNDLKSLLGSTDQTIESLRSKTGEMIAQVERAIPRSEMIENAIIDGVAQAVERSITNLKNNLEDIEKTIAESNQNIRNTTEILDQTTRNVASKFSHAVDASRQSIAAAIDGMIARLNQSIPNKDHVETIIRQGIVGGLEETISTLKRAVKELSGAVTAHMNAYQATGKQLEEMSVQLTNQITDLLTALGRKVRDIPEQLRSTLHGYITELTGTVVENMHGEIERLIAEVNQRFASLAEKIETATQKIALASSHFDETAKTLLINLEQSLVQSQHTLYHRLDDINRTISDTIRAELDTSFRDNILPSIELSVQQYGADVGKLHQTFQAFHREFREQSVTTTNQLGTLLQLIAELNSYRAELQKDLRSTLIMIIVIALLLLLHVFIR